MLIKNGPSSGFPSPGLFTQLRGVYLSGQMLQFPAVGMKLGSIFLSLVLGQTLGIRKAQYELHKLLSAAGDAQGVQKQQQCQELSFPLFYYLFQPPSAWAESHSSPAVLLHSRVLGWCSRVPHQTLGCACAKAETRSANTTDRGWEQRTGTETCWISGTQLTGKYTSWMEVFLCWRFRHSLGMLFGEQGNE